MPPTDFTDLHRTSCWGYSPTEYAEFTEALAEDVLPQISQIYTELLAGDVLPQIAQIYTEAANFRGYQNSQASRPEGAEAHSPGQRPG